jgi:hypothetical protein
MSGGKPQNDLDLPFSREGNGRRQRKIPTRWPMEGYIVWWPLKDSIAWWSMEGYIAWWPMEEKKGTPFYLVPFSPQEILFKPPIFSFDLKVLLYHGFKSLLTHSFPFL